jgi:erythromycin esterase-like protein
LLGVPGYAEFVPLGSYVTRDFGDAAAAIGISALGGSYGRKSPGTELVRAETEWLEARALTGDGSSDFGYLARADLARYGRGTARPLNYNTPVTAPWHEVFDGLLVLRNEHPLKIVHDPKPRRAKLPAQ